MLHTYVRGRFRHNVFMRCWISDQRRVKGVYVTSRAPFDLLLVVKMREHALGYPVPPTYPHPSSLRPTQVRPVDTPMDTSVENFQFPT